MEGEDLYKHFYKHANFSKYFPLLSSSIVDVLDQMRKEGKKYKWDYEKLFDTLIYNYYDEIDSVANPYWK